MQKNVNLVVLVKSFPTNIYVQNLASIQKRASLVKFAHLAEKSGKGSISNLSSKVLRGIATKRDTVQLFAPSGAAPTNQVVASSRAVVRASWVDEKPWKNVAPRGFWS